MPRLIESCPLCAKPLELIDSISMGAERLNSFKCGHFFADSQVYVEGEVLECRAANGVFEARDYQKQGIEFIIKSDFACIIGDQMRLGKTPQALLALRNRYNERTPCLIIVRSANLHQWIREYKIWTDSTPLGIFPILGTTSFIPPGFKTYIISMDSMGSQGRCKHCTCAYHENECKRCEKKGKTCRVFEPAEGSTMVDKLLSFGFKLVIADEAHSFKNAQSNRSQALVKFLHDIHQSSIEREYKFNCIFCKHEWAEICSIDINVRQDATTSTSTKYSNCPQCGSRVGQVQQKMDKKERNNNCGIVLLTGTAIKNRADEYFVPLNLVAPTQFPSLERFRRQWLMQDSKGQWSRINPYAYASFKDKIKNLVLRREKEDVYSDLPVINRIFTLIEPEKSALTNEYNKVLDKIQTKMGDKIDPSYWDYAEDLMTLRRLCGLMKLPWTADYCEASLMDSESARLAIGLHHKDVRDLLKFKLSHIGCLSLSGEDSAERKDWIMTHFKSSPERILAINMLAGGVGMDFHYVDNCIVLERQWSYADEQQFEFRFYNPDKSIKTNPTTIEYILAKGTLDEWWYNMVEVKKQIQGETIGTNWDIKAQPRLFKELLEETISNRL